VLLGNSHANDIDLGLLSLVEASQLLLVRADEEEEEARQPVIHPGDFLAQRRFFLG
jgi:hypothetical protein